MVLHSTANHHFLVDHNPATIYGNVQSWKFHLHHM